MIFWKFRLYWCVTRYFFMIFWKFRLYRSIARNFFMIFWKFRLYRSITRFLSNYQFVIVSILFIHCTTVPMTFASITVFAIEQERFCFMNTRFWWDNIICVNMLFELFRVSFICAPERHWRKQKLVTWRFIRYFMLD